MPTDTGGETIGERLTRLRSALVRVEKTIERTETNGQSLEMGGAATTEIAYRAALRRAADLRAQIGRLEARLDGSAVQSNIALTQTKAD